MKVNSLLICLLTLGFSVAIQAQTTVAGLETNEEYLHLLEQQKGLSRTEDSLLQVVNHTRKLFSEETEDRQKYAKDIIDLENKLFDVRNQKGVVMSAISNIEQEYVLNNLAQRQQTTVSGAEASRETPVGSGSPAITAGSNSGYNTANPTTGSTATPGTIPVQSGKEETEILKPEGVITEQFDIERPQPVPEVRETVAPPPVLHKRFTDIPYLKQTLPADDYRALVECEKKEYLPLEIISQYIVNYDLMKKYAETYESAEREEAEDAYQKLRALRMLNRRISDSVAGIWDYIFDNKIYTYNYLLGEMNQRHLLLDFEKQFQEINYEVASARGNVESDDIHAYPFQKKLLLQYEMHLAEIFKENLIYDSIKNVIDVFSRLHFDFPVIEPELRNFIEYSDFTVNKSAVYNTANPIPALETDMHGIVYRIQVGIFSRAQAVSVFRNVSPVGYEILADGRYRYTVGAYRDLQEARQALEGLTKVGFRKPEIIVWTNGRAENLGDGSVSTAGDGNYYRIEISGAGAVMSDDVKAILEDLAPDKEISRTTDTQGQFVYTLGTFDDRELVEEIIEELNEETGIEAKILVIEL